MPTKSVIQQNLIPYNTASSDRAVMFYVFPYKEIEDLRLLISSSIDLKSQIIKQLSSSSKNSSIHIDIMEQKFIIRFNYPRTTISNIVTAIENLSKDIKIPKNYTKSIFKKNTNNCYHGKSISDFQVISKSNGFFQHHKMSPLQIFETDNFDLSDEQTVLQKLKDILGDNDLLKYYQPKPQANIETRQKKKQKQQTQVKNTQQQTSQKQYGNFDKVTTPQKQKRKVEQQQNKLNTKIIEQFQQQQQLDKMQKQISEISLKLTELQQTINSQKDPKNYNQQQTSKLQQNDDQLQGPEQVQEDNSNQHFQDMLQFCFIQEELISIYKNIIKAGQNKNNNCEQNTRTLFEQISSILLIKMTGQDSYITVKESLQKWAPLFIKNLDNKLKNTHLIY